MTVPYISDLPAGLTITDSGEPLVSKVDAIHAALPALVTEANALATWNETRAGESAAGASNASTSASVAATSASNASTSASGAATSKNTAEAAVTAIGAAPGFPSKTGSQGKALRVNASEDGVLWSGARAIGDTVVSVNSDARQPPEWLECDGSSFSSATYPALYAVLGTTTLPNIDIGGYPFTKVYIQSSF